MKYIYLLIAIVLLTFGHILKTKRWKTFVSIYEETNEQNLLRSLSIGYILNFIFPFRLGDIFRIFFSGRKMKNGIAFSFGTVLLDRYIDIIVIGLIFSIFVIFGVNNEFIYESAVFYILFSIILLLTVFISYFFNKQVKNLLRRFAKIFNKNIEYKVLKTFWSFITSFKDMIFNIDKVKLALVTFLMWFSYFLSYFFISISLSKFGNNISFFDMLVILFSKNTLDLSSLSSIISLMNGNGLCMFIYLIIPLFLLIVYSFKIEEEDTKNTRRLELLPQLNTQERMKFLNNYFSGDNRDYINNYLKINRDITIIKDCTAGSNAKTILCVRNNDMFYRKFAFYNECSKLKNQVTWIKRNKERISITEIIEEKTLDDCFYYDMPYVKNSVDYFSYIHSNKTTDNFKILKAIFKDLNSKFYIDNNKVNKNDIENYIKIKVLDNLNYLKELKEYKSLFKYEYLVINGKKYKNLSLLENYFSVDKLYEIFKDDISSNIHGDLTIENIICVKNGKNDKYYLIDPNPNNIMSSKYMDYAKILQSLHGGYEFLNEIKSVNVIENNINYLFIKSNAYQELYGEYVSYLEDNFEKTSIKSIYFHEIIHWLRLLPYKVKDYTAFVVVYTRFIVILNDIIDLYGVELNEK